MQNKREAIVVGICIAIFIAIVLYSSHTFSQNKKKQRTPKKQSNREIPLPPIIPDPKKIFSKNEIYVMGWNIQNLFDTHNDPYTKDEEYTPQGRFRWTKRILRNKLYNLTDILRRVNNGKGADIIGLSEVENKYVLKRLAQHPNILDLGYKYIYIKDAQDPRGIDVALLSRYKANKIKYIFVYPGARYILYANFVIRGHKLHIFVNHWRSRRGGKKRSESRRIAAAKKCIQKVKQITRKDPYADIIILGDFNDTPDSKSIKYYLKARKYHRKSRALLQNITLNYKNKNFFKTGHLDQIIISKGLRDNIGFSYVHLSTEIISYPFMQESDGSAKRFSHITSEGYSDHFPIAARFILSP